MGIEGLDYRLVNIPLTAGLKTKDDQRAMQPPGLSICSDARFDDLGGIQTRFPSVPIGGGPGNSIFGGGTLTNVRRIDTVNGELVLFTVDSMYSWNAQLSAWVFRGTHLAVNVTETPRFATTGDQFAGDRAELNGTVMFSWTEGAQVFVAAMDKTTGAVLVSPTAITSAAAGGRVVALASRLLLFVVTVPNNLIVRFIDPANPAVGIASAGSSVSAVLNGPYDVVRVDSQDVAVGVLQRTTTTSYTAFTVTAAGVITTTTKARTADGPLAVSTIPGGTQTQVIRANGNNIQGDLLTTNTLADVITGQAIGGVAAPINQIAACHRQVTTGGAFRCYAFWSAQESPTSLTYASTVNWVDNAGAIGAAAHLALQIGIASRAFTCNGSVYVWTTFASATTVTVGTGTQFAGPSLQNTYFLYRDDALLAAKCLDNVGGGFVASTGRLPGVTALTATSFAWCGTRRRRFDTGGGGTSFAAREPVDVQFAIDSPAARRAATIGSTLYIAAGELLQYDGVQLVEVGFHVDPWNIGLIETSGGSKIAGTTYAYKSTYRYENGQGELERSTTTTVSAITLTTGNEVVVALLNSLTPTHKLITIPAVEIWSTLSNPTADSPFYLASSNDPTALTNPNRYIPNTPNAGSAAVFNDTLADAVLGTNEDNPENGGVLESLAPPPASIIFATDTRIFLAGIAGQPDAVWYSRLRDQGEIASFNDALVVLVPPGGGDITAVIAFNETLIVFREDAIYALPGVGFDNTGGGQNFGPSSRISADVGVISAEAVVLAPRGLIFKSSKGWYLLTPQWNTHYIGADVAKFDAETVLSMIVLETNHQIRCVTSGRILVFDYLTEEWSSWSIPDAVSACLWNGTYYYLSSTSNAPMAEQTTFAAGVNYGLDVETGWIKPADVQGFVRIAEYLVLAEYRGAHKLRLRTAFDYEQDGAGNWVYTDDVYWTPTPTVIGSVEQVRRGTTRSRCQAIKIRITACSPAADGTPPTTEAIKLTALTLKVGVRKSTYQRLPAGQKT
jgi:hypothetical protein